MYIGGGELLLHKTLNELKSWKKEVNALKNVPFSKGTFFVSIHLWKLLTNVAGA